MHFRGRSVTSIVIFTSGNASEYSTVADLLVWNISLFLFKQDTSGKSKINITGSSTEEHIPEALS